MLFKTKEILKTHSMSLFNERFPNVGIFLNDDKRLLQLKMIELTEEDLQVARALKPYIEVRVNELADVFYETIGKVKMFREMIDTYSSTSRLHKTLTNHVIEMFEGRIDRTYLENRSKISNMHVKIGLATKWYLAAFQQLTCSMYNIIFDLNLHPKETKKAINAISKIINFEQQIVLEEYELMAEMVSSEKRDKVKLDVKQTIGGISKKLDEQSQRTNEAVMELIASTKSVNELLQHSIQDAQKTKYASNEGYKQIVVLSEQTKEINNKTIDMTKMVQALDESSSKIQAVVEIVKNIAGKTNLLALNSAIEAARAGEHGKGFAVVAEEVRKLADQTKQSVEQIATLIGVSNQVTGQVIESIHQIQILVQDGLVQNEKSMHSFENISKTVDSTISEFESVGIQIEELSNIVEKIGESSESLETAASQLEQTIESF
ncbi:methyl-accepting chemotaxis protein [Lysinibacillus sp. PLM2]|nr:methyl-accepting chemotaxis protein [Lysinibacillus sp. PLM2]